MKFCFTVALFVLVNCANAQTDCIEGDCANGFGKAKYKQSERSFYEGYWLDGMRHGQGTFVDSWGNMFSGNWANDKLTGYSEIKWTNGNTYKGHYSNGRLNGFGELIWSDGTRYKGGFKDGHRSGHGILYLTSNEIKSGYWKNGDLEDSMDEQLVLSYLEKSAEALTEKVETVDETTKKEVVEPRSAPEKLIVQFELNSFSSDKETQAQLKRFLEKFLLTENTRIEITGHTCDLGADEINYEVGLKRANSCKAYLVSNGIPESKIIAKSKGQAAPLQPNKDEKSRSMNRRVEIIISN
jgi:outer membrane protein OmpA-like peptidoglycan-associated protein